MRLVHFGVVGDERMMDKNETEYKDGGVNDIIYILSVTVPCCAGGI